MDSDPDDVTVVAPADALKDIKGTTVVISPPIWSRGQDGYSVIYRYPLAIHDPVTGVRAKEVALTIGATNLRYFSGYTEYLRIGGYLLSVPQLISLASHEEAFSEPVRIDEKWLDDVKAEHTPLWWLDVLTTAAAVPWYDRMWAGRVGAERLS